MKGEPQRPRDPLKPDFGGHDGGMRHSRAARSVGRQHVRPGGQDIHSTTARTRHMLDIC